MGWYPNNNVPADKATYTTRITVPRGWSALATGVLASRRDAGRAKKATSTFVWKETAPTSTYLVSVSVGKFDVNSLDPAKPKKTRPAAGSRNKPLPFYTAITSSLPAKGKAQSAADLGRSSEIVDFYSAYYGNRYPFTSLGGIVTLQSFGLGLETQGKPTYAITKIDSTYGPGVDLVAHELAHQFFGNLVTPARWRDVWLSEGMAVFSAWVWSSTGTFFPIPPRDQYLDVYANAQYPISWRVPPANPARPKDLFDADGMYRRAPATIEAIREILGNDTAFKAMMRRWLTEHAYGNATTEQFIALVKTDRPDPHGAVDGVLPPMALHQLPDRGCRPRPAAGREAADPRRQLRHLRAAEQVVAGAAISLDSRVAERHTGTPARRSASTASARSWRTLPSATSACTTASTSSPVGAGGDRDVAGVQRHVAALDALGRERAEGAQVLGEADGDDHLRQLGGGLDAEQPRRPPGRSGGSWWRRRRGRPASAPRACRRGCRRRPSRSATARCSARPRDRVASGRRPRPRGCRCRSPARRR